MPGTKKKSSWMKGFVLDKPTAEIDKMRMETFAQVKDRQNKRLKYHGK